MIKRICAGCGLVLGYKPGAGVHGVSHGYCDACQDNVIARQMDPDDASRVRMEMGRQLRESRKEKMNDMFYSKYDVVFRFTGRQQLTVSQEKDGTGGYYIPSQCISIGLAAVDMRELGAWFLDAAENIDSGK